MGIDRTVATVNRKLAEINSEAMLQLHKRNREMQITGEDSNHRIKELERLHGDLLSEYKRYR